MPDQNEIKDIKVKLGVQEKTLERLALAVEEVVKAMSKMESMRTEINHIEERVTKQEDFKDSLSKDLSDIKIQSAISSEAITEFKKLRSYFLIAALGVVFAGGFSAYVAMTQKSDSNKLVEQQIQILRKMQDDE